jgi:D-beta-D-heptose 7-phosphate kinase/D-beta-D-heptose 1-phosphate adenosyltransferase
MPEPLTATDPRSLRVTVAGDVIADLYSIGTSTRLSPEAPVPVVDAVHTEWRLGGAANVARQLRALEVDVTLVGVVGDDEAGAEVLRLCREAGITTHFATAARPTMVKQRIIANGQHVVRLDSGHAAPMPAGVERQVTERIIAAGGDALALADYAKGLVGAGLATAVLAAASRAGRPVVVDSKAPDLRNYAGATVVTSNEGELRAAAGVDDADAAVALLRAALPGTSFVVTRGPRGMTVVPAAGSAVDLPAAARQVVDVTGAGDVVTGIIALGLAARWPLLLSAQVANTAAGLSVARLGAVAVSMEDLVPTLQEFSGDGPGGLATGAGLLAAVAS